MSADSHPSIYLGDLLDSLEVPACDCDPEAGPCECLLAADHELDLDQWGDLLLSAAPAEYAEPPGPAEPTHTLPGTAERIAVYARRHRQGRGLWHADDLHFSQVDAVGLPCEVARNGHAEPGAPVLLTYPAPEPTNAA